jgi:hypothetical protein
MIDKDILEKLYIEQKLPAYKIAKIYNVSASTVHNWLIIIGLKERCSPLEFNGLRKCTKCGIDKELIEFTPNQRWCKTCVKNYNKKYRSSRKKEKREKDKEYRDKNRDKLLAQKRAYYYNNIVKFKEKSKLKRMLEREKIREQRRKSRERNKENIKEQKRAYYKRNKDRIVKKVVEYRKNSRIVDPSKRALDSCRVRIRECLKSFGKRTPIKIRKHAKTLELIGCSGMELKLYIESKFKPGMTWENYGIKGWHIDHKIPCASFKNFNDIETQKSCFNYKNLQPLWYYENLSKSSKIIEEC